MFFIYCCTLCGKIKSMEKYRDWNILEELPEGWVIDKTAGSPAPKTVFITNGKSVLNGQKRALLKVEVKKHSKLPIYCVSERFLEYEEWFAKFEDDINIELAETGADREIDFDSEREFDKRYEMYLNAC